MSKAPLIFIFHNTGKWKGVTHTLSGVKDSHLFNKVKSEVT